MNVVTVTSALFCLGLFGVMTRRQLIGVLASVELMLGAANLQIVAYAAAQGEPFATGQAFALIVLVLAAAEAAVGLAILVALARRDDRTEVVELMELEG
ncbi:MAG: NADH-quinone oxidoreductase subunit NuoK [Coriobacteriia bacterium]